MSRAIANREGPAVQRYLVRCPHCLGPQFLEHEVGAPLEPFNCTTCGERIEPFDPVTEAKVERKVKRGADER